MSIIEDRNGNETWKEFRSRLTIVQQELVKSGLKRDCYLILLMEDIRSFYLVLEACINLKIVVVPLPPDIPSKKLSEVAQQIKSTVYISRLRKDKEDLLVGEVAQLKIFVLNKVHLKPNDVIKKSGTTLVFFSSGTTGESKGICVSNDNIEFTTKTLIDLFGISSADRILSIIPPSFDYGLYQYFMARDAEAALYLRVGYHHPAKLHEECQAIEPTILPLMPAILDMYSKLDQNKLSDLIYSRKTKITSTGDALTAKNLKTLAAQFPKSEIYSMYGLTECKRVSCLLPEELKTKWPSVGRPIPGTQVDVLSNNGDTVPIGSQGKLRVSGPHVTLGYLTDKVSKDCQFIDTDGNLAVITNDIVSLDRDGYIFFHGRSDNIVKVMGKRISLLEITNALKSHPSVAAAVTDQVLVSDEKVIIAKVILRSTMTATDAELKAHVFAMTNESHMIPSEIKFAEKLVLSGNLKAR